VSGAWQDRYLHRFYDRSSGWVDGTTEFHELCARVLPRGGRLIEVGAGPSNRTSRFLATLGEVHGLDPDPAVQGNDALRSAAVLAGDAFPFEPETFDGCVSNYVVEHVADPAAHLREVGRVLRPGAAYVFRTPNRVQFVALASSLTPHRLHVRLANRLREWRAEKALTQADLARMAGVSRKTINTVENGVFVPSVQLALVLAQTLGTDVEALFQLVPAKER
jgi:putative transcriptional regulator